jgi:predicted dehydrogenase
MDIEPTRERTFMTEKVLRVGVLGQGRSGYGIHCKWLRQVPHQYEIVAVADELPERRKEARAELGALAYKSHLDLLDDPKLGLDLVVNALPSFLHPQGTIDALARGHHVVCEKPLARTVKDFDRMVAAARKHRRLLLPFQNSRFNPVFQKVQEVIASGALGEIIHVRISFSGFARRWDWQTCQEYWGGNLLNTGPHPVDQAIVLFGDRMPEVASRLVSANPYGDAEDFALVMLSGRGAPTIEVLVSSFLAYPQGDQYSVSGTRGGLAGGNSGLKWKYFNPEKAPRHARFSGAWSDKRQYCSEQLPWVEEQWAPAEGTTAFEGMSRGFYDNTYDILVNGGTRVVTLEQVRRQIAVMEACHRQNPMPRMKRRFLAGKAGRPRKIAAV